MTNNSKDLRLLHQRYPGSADLSETYLQLEGFLDSKVETTHRASCTRQQPMAKASQPSEDTWADTLITLIVLFTLLIGSSIALGVGASRLIGGLRQLSQQVVQPPTQANISPTDWRF